MEQLRLAAGSSRPAARPRMLTRPKRGGKTVSFVLLLFAVAPPVCAAADSPAANCGGVR